MAYRVIQWATGSMGKTCLRSIIDHPDLELVGLYVYNKSKAGKDAGEIAQRGLTGVSATRSMDEILDLEADVVVHAPRLQFPYDYHNKDMCRILASGKNLITINGHSFPAHHGIAYADEFEQACKNGGVSFFSTGLNPGFVVEKIATAATGICTELDNVTITEVFDCIAVPDYDYVFKICGMGSEPDKLDLGESGPITSLISGMYAEVIALLAFRMGMKLERIESDHAITIAPEDIQARAGVIPSGTVAATHWRWHGIIQGKRLISLNVSWIMGNRLPGLENWDHWKIEIRGKPGIDITMNLVEPENTGVKTKSEQYAVAGSVINAIPEVCGAPSGILHFPLFAPFKNRF